MPVDGPRNAVDWLADATYGLEVRFPPGMPPGVQRLMGVLGVRVVFDESVDGSYRGERDTEDAA